MDGNQQTTQSDEPNLRKLFDLSSRLVVSFNLDEILQATVEGVTELTGLDTAAVYLLENDTLRLCNTMPPLPAHFPEELRYSLLRNFPHMCKAIETASPVYIKDTSDIFITPEEDAIVKLRNLRTLLFLPLITKTEAMGSLIVGSVGKPILISNRQTELSHTLANFAALTVKNARLYQAGQRYVKELEQTLAERKKAETEREKLRGDLIQSQKMDAMGQLAGGIAHDFNNMLCGIIGHAELLQFESTEENVHQIAKEIVTIGRRSADLISQLLAFSRKGQNQILSVDLNKIIEDVVSILRHTINPKIEITTSLDTSSCQTMGDPAQIQSALLNLAVNARDAMPDGGKFSINTLAVHIDKENCQQYTCELSPGQYVELTLSDTGIGIDPVIMPHIFEPFFTTKKEGQGTGMGLSAVYGTMKSHNGAISVSSIPGQGTTFRLFFPLITQTETSTTEAAFSIPDIHSNTTGFTVRKDRILIIDDELIVAKIASEHLRSAGYIVDMYTNSVEALAFFKEYHQTVSLVILDMLMPQLDGPAIYHAVKRIRPDIRMILASGYSIGSAAQALLNDGAYMFIPKPFSRSHLLSAVKKVLQK